jgi:acyl-coenzyme A synthetase/AMP-(fatty) acid ligase
LQKWLEANEDFGISPGEIFTVEKIPRNDLGKLQRHELKKMLVGMKGRMRSQAESAS